MDSKHQKIVFLSQDLTGVGAFSKTVNLDFTPKILKVKNISYRYTGQDATIEAAVSALRLDGVGKIGTVMDGQFMHPELSFNIDGVSIGNYMKFSIIDENEALETARNGVLFIVLEFLG